jgi:hypothetical protein
MSNYMSGSDVSGGNGSCDEGEYSDADDVVDEVGCSFSDV